MVIFFFKHKTSNEMRISDWSSHLCSSYLCRPARAATASRSSSPASPTSPQSSKRNAEQRFHLNPESRKEPFMFKLLSTLAVVGITATTVLGYSGAMAQSREVTLHKNPDRKSTRLNSSH